MKIRNSTVLWVFSLLLLTACGDGGGSGGASNTQGNTQNQNQAITTVASDGNTQFNQTAVSTQLSALPIGTLTDDELAGLLLMREEEKLARDVYLALFEAHGLQLFSNISASEETHTEAMLRLLERYDITDPVESNAAGEFTNLNLQSLYDVLVATGSNSLLDALYVGAQIEELDIADITRLEAELMDNDDIALVYENLKKGSRNHLRAFYTQIVAQGGAYMPQYISQELFDEIVNSDIERGG